MAMRQLPQSIEAEQALLGTMFLYEDTVVKAYEENLIVSDFFLPANQKIFQVVMDLYNEKKPHDVTSVITRLTDMDQINAVGGAAYVLQLAGMTFSSGNAAYYIEIVQSRAVLRKLIATSQQIIEEGYENPQEVSQVLDEAESMILAVTRDRKTSDFQTTAKVVGEVYEKIVKLQKEGRMTGVPSGFTILDGYTNGFQKGNLIILAARPSVGKTAFALNLAANAAKYNHTVAMFSLEMPAEHLTARLLSAASGVSSKKINTGSGLNNEDWNRLKMGQTALEKAKIYLDDSSSIKVSDIFAKCRKLKNESGLDLIIVDYLQLLEPSVRKNDNRQQEVAEMSRGLKGLARELDCPVIALSQLSRSIEQRSRGKDSAPMLSDLRESGAIEQDADIVMFLHQPRKDSKDDEDEEDQTASNNNIRQIELRIAKHRNGATGSFMLSFEPELNRFTMLSRMEDE